MSRQQDIERSLKTMGTMAEISSVFEGIASMRIAKIKNQVLQATEFFNELWHIYSQLRVDSLFRFGRGQSGALLVTKNCSSLLRLRAGLAVISTKTDCLDAQAI